MADRYTNPYFLQWFKGGWPFYEEGAINGVPSKYENMIYGLQMTSVDRLGYNFHRTQKWTLFKTNICVSMQPTSGSFTISSRNCQCGDFRLDYKMAHEPQHYVLFENENVIIKIEPSTHHETWFWLNEYTSCRNQQYWTNIESNIERIHRMYPQYENKIIFGADAIKSHWVERLKEVEMYIERKGMRDMYSYNSRMYIGGYM